MSDERYVNRALSWTAGYFDWALGVLGPKCESPIERGLLVGFVALRNHDRRIRIDGLPVGPIATEWEATIYQQHCVESYRVDFAICITDGKGTEQWLAVECDGHDFHERTKEQAQRDKARDRELTRRGYRVLRFTGSEIYRDNMACALQVHDQIIAIAEGGK